MKDFGKVAVLMGGWSPEREISLIGGAAVLRALQNSGVDASGLDLQKPARDLLADTTFERAFIMLHGRGGEDGTLQGMLEMQGLPYTGSGVAVSALCMDKLFCKKVWRGDSLPTPDFVEIRAGEADLKSLIARLGFPLALKPVSDGSSLGVRKVDDEAALTDALADVETTRRSMFAEQWIGGEEYTVGFIGDTLLPPVRIRTKRAFYDFTAKYEDDSTSFDCPGALSEGEIADLHELCARACHALHAEQWGRIDLMRDEQDGWWLIEINTVPGMTSHSLVPMAAKAAGKSFSELVLEILATSDRDKN